MLAKNQIIHLLIATLIQIHAAEGVWMPDCGKKEHKKKPQCVCKNPSSWEDNSVCEQFWKRPSIKETVQKMTRIVNGEAAPRDAYPVSRKIQNLFNTFWMDISKRKSETESFCLSHISLISLPPFKSGSLDWYGEMVHGQSYRI